jgi:OmpA-OmpF porin, OOP family
MNPWSKNMQLKKATVAAVSVVALALLATMPASAQDAGWYIGANAGQSRANLNNKGVTNDLLDAGLTTTRITEDTSHFGYKVFGAYQFNRYFALEGGYFDLGNFNIGATTEPAGALRGEIKVQGVNFDLVGLIPLGEKFAAFGRGGVIYTETNDSFTGSGAVNVLDGHHRERAANYKFGLGLQYSVSDTFGLRLEAERYRVDDALRHNGDVDLLSAGFVYRFGGKTQAPAPAYAAAAPSPVVQPTPVVQQNARYCTALDFQFEVNHDEIQREEEEKLAVIGRFLKKYPDTTAIIEGHTDNVGSPEQNMALSKRRADSVVNYLERVWAVEPKRLSAVGYGESRPIADNSTEEGKRANRRIGAVVPCATDLEGLIVVPARLTMALLVEFDPQKSAVEPEYRDELRKLADFLKANPTATATVEGHTGNLQAGAAEAMKISQLRAQNVVNYLVDEFGIERSRLTAEGFGQTRRAAYNTTLGGQQDNRRVNVIINYPR